MKKRRALLLFWSAALLCLPSCATPDAAHEPVRVQSGLLSGVDGASPGVRVYQGVPYAAPPVGDLRWKPPQPMQAWEGIRQADRFSPACIQNKAGTRLPWTEEFMVQEAISEDCLYLNVWTAAQQSDERRPVLVYIHGGGFVEGSGAVAVYNGEALALKGLVVVTINYRMGALGFLAHPELTAESGHQASGNYGMMDQIAALQWVRDNIAAFGGDPDRVTIAGQSAGAMSVYLLTASPLAKGLFHRAIIQSGPGALASLGIASTRNPLLSDAEQDGRRFAEDKGAASLEALRALPVEALTASTGDSPPLRFRPIVDGWFLPEDVGAIFAAGTQHDVPTLTGMTADETSAFPGFGRVTAEAFRQQAQERFGDRADTFLALYPARTDEEASQSQRPSGRDFGLTALRRLAAERAQTARTDLYLYLFERAIPWPEHPEFGAFHSVEVPYVFSNLHLLDRPWEDADRHLAEVTSSCWANFAATGDPNGDGLPAWPAYDASDARIMRLGANSEAEPLPAADKAAFFDAYLSGQAAR